MSGVALAPSTHRLALVVATATLLLIVAGGLVTNTGAALAVPDWPTTFGYNMFLYPWSQMIGGILLEHSHRLLGAVVGLLTVSLGVTIWLTDCRGWLRALGVLAVGLVCLQGLLGGLRVVLLRDALAILHGSIAHAFFALTVTLAVMTSRGWAVPAAPVNPGEARLLVWLSSGVVGVLYGQIVLGALATHAGWMTAHVSGAPVAVIAAAVLILRVRGRHAGESELSRGGRVLGVVLVVQVALGLGAYVVRFSGLAVPGGEVAVIGLPVAHRAVGALLFGAVVTLALQAWRRRSVAVAGVRESIGTGLVAGRVSA